LLCRRLIDVLDAIFVVDDEDVVLRRGGEDAIVGLAAAKRVLDVPAAGDVEDETQESGVALYDCRD
jgi:hypothetical protein